MNLRQGLIFSLLIGSFLWPGVSNGALSPDFFLPGKDLPDGWVLLDGPHRYTPKSLFEHIDGQAELYLKYGYRTSVFAVYQNRRSREDQIEVDIYDMGNVLQAFGVFSRLRNDSRPMGIGFDSCLDDHSVLFYQGRYFVMCYAVESNPSALRQFAEKISIKMPKDSAPPREISCFPAQGLHPGSIQYFSEGLLGHQFLKRGFQGIYRAEQAEEESEGSKLFLSIYNDKQEALQAFKRYKENLSRNGKIFSDNISSAGGLAGNRVLKGEDPYQGKVVIFQKDIYLLGEIGYKKDEMAERRLAEFMKNLVR